jgi:hypothetical protein
MKHGPETGSFVLRALAEDVPLSADGTNEPSDIEISCIEYLNENIYVGTSAAEILHFVLIPSDSADASSQPTLILASRLQPPFTPSAPGATSPPPGIQQILLLPNVNKACILCNGMVSFFSLPELSPAFGNAQVKNCSWVGGVDLNHYNSSGASGAVARDGSVIIMSQKNRIRLIRVGEEEARVIRVCIMFIV